MIDRRSILKLVAAQVRVATPDEALLLDFEKRWCAVAEIWNSAAEDLKKGLDPVGKIQKLDHAIEHLQHHPYWPKIERRKKC